MKPATQIVEMDQERDRKTCITLDMKVTGANRELAQWLVDHPRYSGAVVAAWLGCSKSRINYLRQWAQDGFNGTPRGGEARREAERQERSDHRGGRGALKTNNNSEDDEYTPPDIDHPPRGAEWEKDPEDRDPPDQKSKTRNAKSAGNSDDVESEIVPPEVLEDNMLHVLGGMNENARIFNKFFKISAFDREAAKRIVTAIDKTISKLRSIQSTLSSQE